MSIFKKKFVSLLVFLLILIIPFQTRYFLSIENINSSFFEYGSISIYFIDLLILFLIIFQVGVLIKNKIFLNKKNIILLITLVVFNLVSFFSTFFVFNKDISIYFSIKLLLFSTFGFLLSVVGVNKLYVLYATIYSSTIQSFIAIYQFINQRVIGNKYLGISTQDPTSLGVSVLESSSERILRAYGSFSHPNILAFFILIGVVLCVFKIINLNRIKEKSKILFYKKAFYLYIFGINFLALILTFSRIAILLGFSFLLLMVLYLIFKIAKYNLPKYKRSLNYILLCFFISFCITINFSNQILMRFDSSNRLNIKSNTERIGLISESYNIIKENFLNGVGPRNYSLYKYNIDKNLKVWELSPVHNVYLLVFSELGIFGFIFFIILLIITLVNAKNVKFLICFILFLLIGIFDHFIWSENVGLILLFLFIGLNNSTKYTVHSS